MTGNLPLFRIFLSFFDNRMLDACVAEAELACLLTQGFKLFLCMPVSMAKCRVQEIFAH